MLDISPEQIPWPVNFKAPSVKLKTSSKNRPHRYLSHNKDYGQDLGQSVYIYITKRDVRPLQADENKYEKIKNLTIELTTLQLFIKEQFYIIKKQIEDMTNTCEPTNRKSISSPQEEIDYLWDKNHAKTQIIKQITDMKVVPSNSDLTTGACSKVATTHIVLIIIIKNLQLTYKLV